MSLHLRSGRAFTSQLQLQRHFSSSAAVYGRLRGKLTAKVVNDRLNAVYQSFPEEPEDVGDKDTTSMGHILLGQQRQLLHYLRLIEHEIPQLVEYRKPFIPPSPLHPLAVRSISYGGEPHLAALKRVIVAPVALLPLKDDRAKHRFKVLAGPRWSEESPKDAGFGRDENIGKHGFIKIACEDFPEPAMNLKWASDALDRLIIAANDPKNKVADVPLDTRHLDAKVRKAKKGDHVRGRGGVRPTIKDFPKEWLPVLPSIELEPDASTQ